MVLTEVIEIVKKQSIPSSLAFKEARNTYYSITLHTKGARPKFKDLSSKNNAGEITPPNYLGEEYQTLFDKFLLSTHPREEEVTRYWRYSQYKPLTKAPFQRLINVFSGLIYQESKFSISVDDENNNKYLLENNFSEKNNFVSLFKNVFLHALLEDPNGYIAVIPKQAGYKQTDNTKALEISFLYIRIIDVLHADDDNLIFKTPDGKYSYWLNNQDIIRFIKNEKGEWVQETDEATGNGYFAHKFGFIPAIKLGGTYNNLGYYESYINNAIPIADEFISSYSSEQLIDKEASHPYIQQATIDCPTCSGTGKLQEIVDVCDLYPQGTRQIECTTCHGKKQISINPSERYEVPTEEMDKDMVRIINPNIAVNQYHHDKNADIKTDILDALNLLKIDESQSGVAKTIDRDNLYRLTKNVSDRLFEIKEFCLKCYVAYRSPDVKFEGFTIKKPNDFNIQTDKDLMEELIQAQNNGLPVNIRQAIIKEFVSKRHKGNDYELKANAVISSLDPIHGYTLEEVKTAIELGLFSADDVKKSRKIKDVIKEILETKTQDYFRQKSILELIKEIKSKL